MTFKLTAFPCFAASISIGIGKCVRAGTGSLKPKPASKMALDAKAPQPIAKWRRVNIVEFRASSLQHITALIDPTD
jgi:hypothetical protein